MKECLEFRRSLPAAAYVPCKTSANNMLHDVYFLLSDGRGGVGHRPSLRLTQLVRGCVRVMRGCCEAATPLGV